MYNSGKMNATVRSIWLGLRNYQEVWDLQKALHSSVLNGTAQPTLILVEHPPVITLGKHAKENNLLVGQEELDRRGVALFRIERGGDITFHGPGQLVGYPILDLKAFQMGVSDYVRTLEESLIRLLAGYGIEGFRREGLTGVWTKSGKVAAIGVAVKRWVTFHGFALNVTTDLTYFNLINPCGMNEPVASIESISGKRYDLAQVASDYLRAFGETFRASVIMDWDWLKGSPRILS